MDCPLASLSSRSPCLSIRGGKPVHIWGSAYLLIWKLLLDLLVPRHLVPLRRQVFRGEEPGQRAPQLTPHRGVLRTAHQVVPLLLVGEIDLTGMRCLAPRCDLFSRGRFGLVLIGVPAGAVLPAGEPLAEKTVAAIILAPRLRERS